MNSDATWRCYRVSLVVLVVAAASLSGGGALAGEAPQTQIELVLHEAVWGKGDQQVKGGPTLLAWIPTRGSGPNDSGW